MTTSRAYAASEQRCMFGTAAAFCGKPAALHVMQEDGAPTMGCSDHAGWWTYHQHRDHHALAANCGMPGTYWMFSTPEAPGFCFTDEQPEEPVPPATSAPRSEP